LRWLPTTEIEISEIEDEFCSHALVDQADGARVRVIYATTEWPVEKLRRSLKDG